MKHGHLLRTKTVPAFFVATLYCLASGAAQPPTGTMVAAIQTASGNYLTAVNGGGLGGPDTGSAAVALHTDATVAGPWETFTVVWLNPTYTRFALRTSGGNYVTAVDGGGIGGPNDSSAPVHTDATSIAEWERLTLTFLPNNQVTINAPDGLFLTAVNGGGISAPGTSPIHTDAVQHAAWEAFTLVRIAAVSDDVVASTPSAPSPAPSPAPTAAPDKGIKLTSTERATITQHLGKRLPYHVGVSRIDGFPEVLRVSQYIDDAGLMTLAMIVDGAWIEWGGNGLSWIPDEVTHHVLQARGWPTLDQSKRKSLALRWIISALPPDFSSQTTADGGHAPEVSVENTDVIVRIWLIHSGTSIAGPRITRYRAPTVFRFKPDGSMSQIDAPQP
jgi:hypothetical protein